MKGKHDERHLARTVALATMFCLLFDDNKTEECLSISKENLGMQSGEWNELLAQKIIRGVQENEEKITEIIRTCAPQWPLDKIFKIDLVILEIAIYELLFDDEAPEKVAVDEAVELAKEFGNDTSSKFVNGVLGTVLENKELYVPKENTENNNQ